MENELEVEEIDEIVEEKDEEGNDTTDWKSLALKNQGIAKRLKTKLEKAKDKAKEPPKEIDDKPEPKEKQGFDYAEKAFLTANGIKIDEYPLVEEVMKSTGKSLEEVLEAKYFQAELKEMRELKASKDAIPSGSKRSVTSARDTVDYWISKGELPPLDQPELRRKVVQEKTKRAERGNKFTDNPVA